MKRGFIFLIALTILFVSSFVSAATYYMATNGNDANPGTSVQPWANFNYAIEHMISGDKLILKDGIYTQSIGEFFENQPYNSYSLPSGSYSQYTIVAAENDGKAVINNGYIYLGGAVNDGISAGSSYVQIEGLKLNRSYINIARSHHVKLLRIGIKNGVPPNSRYGEVISIGESSHHILLEDVWIVGSMRYGIDVYESYKIILRRVIARYDGNTEREPKSGITFYGATDGITGAYDGLCQNCIAIDYNPGESLGAGIQNVHAVKNVKYYGCISLNLPCNGFANTEEYPAREDDIINSVAWDLLGAGIPMRDGDPINTTLINQVTIGNSEESGIAQWSGSYGQNTITTIKNSLFYDNAIANSGGDIINYNWYYPASQAQGSNFLTSNLDILYILRTPDTGTGESGAKRGATIEKRYGVSGTLYGEPGYNIVTNENLWPWPYEDRIKKDFAEADGFAYPTRTWDGQPYTTVNNPKRGFAANGNGLYGGPITLTSYIWEYLGNACPSDICNYNVQYHPTDTNQNGIIEMKELIAFIGLWKQGSANVNDVMTALDRWYRGS